MTAVVLAAVAMSGTTAGAAGPDQPTASNTLRLQLQITGLTPEGCTLAIRPAHPGCQFEPVERRIVVRTSGGMVRLDPIELKATSSGADRDCSFAITLAEPGKGPRTYLRGVRLTAAEPGQAVPVQTVKLYLTAPSLAAHDDPAKVRR
jgi:hypothetical protein